MQIGNSVEKKNDIWVHFENANDKALFNNDIPLLALKSFIVVASWTSGTFQSMKGLLFGPFSFKNGRRKRVDGAIPRVGSLNTYFDCEETLKLCYQNVNNCKHVLPFEEKFVLHTKASRRTKQTNIDWTRWKDFLEYGYLGKKNNKLEPLMEKQYGKEDQREKVELSMNLWKEGLCNGRWEK